MANKLYEESDVKAIADAIREEKSSTDTYIISEMAPAILTIYPRGNLIVTSYTSTITIQETGDSYTYGEEKSAHTFENLKYGIYHLDLVSTSGIESTKEVELFSEEKSITYPPPRIPTIYTQVSYIVANGVQWFDTGWYTDLTEDLVIKGSAGFVTSDRGMLLSNYGSSGNNISIELYSNQKFRLFGSSSEIVLISTGAELNTLFDYNLSYVADTNTVTVTANGVSSTGSFGTTDIRKAGSTTILGSDHTHRYPYGMYGETYIYNPDLVLHLIPAKRNSDSVVGMYDLVTKQFFVSTYGTFVPGTII